MLGHGLDDGELGEPASIEVTLHGSGDGEVARITAELFLHERIELEAGDPALIAVVIPALQRRAAELGPL